MELESGRSYEGRAASRSPPPVGAAGVDTSTSSTGDADVIDRDTRSAGDAEETDRETRSTGAAQETDGATDSVDVEHEAYPVGEVVEFDEDGVSVLETDQTPGGWASVDINRRPPMPADRDPDRALRRTVGTMLWEWRSRRGLTQAEAAARLGMEQSRLSRLERGRAAVGIDLLVRIAGVTGSAVVLTVEVADAGAPVRRLVGRGSRGRAAMQVVVAGPEVRRVA